MERRVVGGQRRAPRVGVEEQQRLVAAFNAARDHVLPSGTDLQTMDSKGENASGGEGVPPPPPRPTAEGAEASSTPAQRAKNKLEV